MTRGAKHSEALCPEELVQALGPAALKSLTEMCEKAGGVALRLNLNGFNQFLTYHHSSYHHSYHSTHFASINCSFNSIQFLLFFAKLHSRGQDSVLRP